MKTKRYVKSWLKTFGEISPDHLTFSVALIQKLAMDGPVHLSDLEEQTQIKMRRLKNFVKKRPQTQFDENHLIVGHGPVSLNPTEQKLVLENKTLYAPSSWEALISVFYLMQPLVWKSKCALTGREIEVKVMQEGVETEMEGIYISFLHPDELTAEKIDSIHEWCVTLCKDDTADQYLEKYPDRIAIPLSQAYQFARDVFEFWASEPE